FRVSGEDRFGVRCAAPLLDGLWRPKAKNPKRCCTPHSKRCPSTRSARLALGLLPLFLPFLVQVRRPGAERDGHVHFLVSAFEVDGELVSRFQTADLADERL